MIALDFYSGSHGHFLEYVINAYIFKVPKVDNIFTPLGTCHLIRKDQTYMSGRIVEARHYSELDIPVNGTVDNVIRITVDNLLEHVCYQINVNCRAGDIPAEKKNLAIPITSTLLKADLRKNYYSKYTDPELGYQTPKPENWVLSADNAPFNFPMSSMYNLLDFYRTLNQLADYLNQTFLPDASLSTVWHKFVELNHGYQSWQKCQQVFDAVVSSQNKDVFLETHEEAVLNVLFAEAFKMYSGPLHELNQWPTNARDLFEIIENHLVELDTV